MFDLEKIVDHYGLSDSFDNCGYILKDGRILQYTKFGTMEHFEVERFWSGKKCGCQEVNTKPKCQDKPFCRYSIKHIFMADGNVRCISNVRSFHIMTDKINWDSLTEYIEHHLFYNEVEFVAGDYQNYTIKNGWIDPGPMHHQIFNKTDYQEKLKLVRSFYE